MDNAPQPASAAPQESASALGDPSDIPGAITDPTQIAKMGSPTPTPQTSSAQPQTLDPADIPGAIIDAPDNERYTSYGQQALAAAEGAAQGLVGPLAPMAELATGLTTADDIRERAEQNPELHTVSKLGSFIGSAFTGVGEAKLLGVIGDAAAAKSGLTAATYAQRIGAGALKGATEFGLLSAGDEATRAILQDPDQTAQTAMLDIGLNSALGLVGGGSLGAFGRLLEGGAGAKAAQEMENFKGQLAYRTNVPEPTTAMGDELTARHSELGDIYDETYGVSGTKAKAIAESLPPQVSDVMLAQANDTLTTMRETLARMKGKPELYPARLVAKLEGDVAKFEGVVYPKQAFDATPSPSEQFLNANDKLAQATTPKEFPAPLKQVTSQDIFSAQQDLKQTLQAYSQYSKFIKPTDDAYEFVHAMKPIATSLKEALEDANTWGKAGTLQKNINGAFVRFKPFMEAFEKTFTDAIPDIETGAINRNVSLGKIQTFVNQAGTFRDGAKKAILKGFLDNGERFANALDDAYEAAGAKNPFTHSPMVVTRKSLGDLTPGMKAANALVDQGFGKGAAHSMAGGLGAGVGGTLAGVPGATVGAIIGERALGPYFEKMLPILGKSFFDQVSSWRGLKAAGSYVEAAVKGQKLMSQATKNVFKAGAEVLPVSAIPNITSIHKLNQRLVASQQNPQAFAQNASGNALGTYMPNHAQSFSQTMSNAVGYINSQRPNTLPGAPLDNKREPSAVKQGAFNNLLTVAQQPLSVMAKVKQGTVTPDDLQHLNALYPAAYNQMKESLSHAMVEQVDKHGVASIPYKTRIGMSLFLGQPMDSTFTPQAIQSAQPMPQVSPGAPAQPKGKRSGGSTKHLNTISDQALTPLQAREKREGMK